MVERMKWEYLNGDTCEIVQVKLDGRKTGILDVYSNGKWIGVTTIGQIVGMVEEKMKGVEANGKNKN